jgi:hypothetical protein
VSTRSSTSSECPSGPTSRPRTVNRPMRVYDLKPSGGCMTLASWSSPAAGA